MDIDTIEIIGLVAATLTTSAFVPQVYKTWKTKSAANLSLTMFLVFFIGIMLWLVYGILIDSLSMVIANILTGALSLILIYFKLSYKK